MEIQIGRYEKSLWDNIDWDVEIEKWVTWIISKQKQKQSKKHIKIIIKAPKLIKLKERTKLEDTVTTITNKIAK